MVQGWKRVHRFNGGFRLNLYWNHHVAKIVDTFFIHITLTYPQKLSSTDSSWSSVAKRGPQRTSDLMIDYCPLYSFKHILYEGFPVISPKLWQKCEQIVTPSFHFDHLLTQVDTKSLYFIHASESAIILAHFFGVWLKRSSLSPKKWLWNNVSNIYF